MARERLQSYSIHEKPDPSADRVDRAEALQFVQDGFLRHAFLLPPVWLASRGVWLGVFAYGVGAGAILVAAWLLALPGSVTALAFLALHLIFASEADEMLRAHLAAIGWTMVGQVTGTGRLDCERRFYDQWLPSVPMTSSGNTPSRATQSGTHPQLAAGTPAGPAGTPPKPFAGTLGSLLSQRPWRRP